MDCKDPQKISNSPVIFTFLQLKNEQIHRTQYQSHSSHFGVTVSLQGKQFESLKVRKILCLLILVSSTLYLKWKYIRTLEITPQTKLLSSVSIRTEWSSGLMVGVCIYCSTRQLTKRAGAYIPESRHSYNYEKQWSEGISFYLRKRSNIFFWGSAFQDYLY